MKQWKKDLIYGLILTVVSTVLLINSLRLDTGGIKFVMAQAGSYSAVWESVMLLCSLLLVGGALKKRKNDPDTESSSQIFNGVAMFTIISLALYVLALGYFGFIASTIVYLLIATIIYTWKAGKFKTEDGEKKSKAEIAKQIALFFVISVVITIATYYIFTKGVGMMMPQSKFW